MNDTEYHARILRLPFGRVPETHRPVMSEEDVDRLLTGDVYVTEKLDGRLHQVDASQFTRFGTEVFNYFYEELRIRHSVFYDALPNWYVLLDVASGDRILPPEQREEVIKRGGSTEFEAPVVVHDTAMTREKFELHLQEWLNRVSSFSSEMQEGMVVKNYEKQLFGKMVRFEFYRGVEESEGYLRRRVQEGNRLLLPVVNREA